MPLILLAEDDSSTIDHVRSALASQGWLVKTVGTRDQALRAASEFAPQLVLVNDRLAGVEDLVRTFSRRSGGPGVVLLAEDEQSATESSTETPDVDAILVKPVDAGNLIETIRQGLVNGKGKPAPPTVTDAKQILSSEEIFGDLLDDFVDPDSQTEAEAAPEESAPEPIPEAEIDAVEPLAEATPEAEIASVEESEPEAETVVDPTPSPVLEEVEVAETLPVSGLEDLEEVVREGVEAWADSIHPEESDQGAPEELEELARAAQAPPDIDVPAEEDLETKLEDTLAGVLAAALTQADDDKPAARKSAAETSAVDALLRQALGDLELGAPAVTPTPQESSSKAIDDQLEALAAAVEVEPVAEIEEPDLTADLEELTGVTTEPQTAATPSAQEEDLSAIEPEPTVEPVAAETTSETPAATVEKTESVEFGEYTLEKRIGVGGMASVWKARRKGVEGFEKRVAIKKILPHAAENEDFVEMFIDEAKLAAQLNHGNITHIYDLGKIDDDYFIAMEYVDGKNLRQILDLTRKKQQAVPIGVALFIASQTAEALDYAHRSRDFDDAELGLVHRDVSPQNVLLSYEGDIKLCDFGIAKAVSKISTTQMGALKGKLQYMSPEQAWGRAIDHRSDLFSLGTLLYEMLTGERLFTGDSEMAVLEAVREADVGTQIIQSAEIPAGIKGLLLRALAKEPEDRFQSAEEFQKGLEELILEDGSSPGPRSLAAFVHDLLDIKSEIPEPAPVPEPHPEEQQPLEVQQQLEIPSDIEFETDEPETPEDSTPWLRRVLTKLLPVILVVVVGGGIIAGLMQIPAPAPEPGADSTSRAGSPLQAEPGIADTEALQAPSGQPPPELSESDTETTPPTPSSTNEPQTQTAPAEEPSTSPARAGTPPATQSRQTGAGNSDVQRQVEQDLQRVQELMAKPEPSTQVARSEPPSGESDAETVSGTRPGDLVLPGPGVLEPRLVELDRSRLTGVAGPIRVNVLVDETGRARQVRWVEDQSMSADLKAAFEETILSADFDPARKDGVPVRMWFPLPLSIDN